MSRQLLVSVTAAALAVAASFSAPSAAADGTDRGVTRPARGAFPTVIGSLAGTPAVCGEQIAIAQATVHPGSGPSYTVPHDGVITAVSHQAGSVAGGHLRALVFAGAPALTQPTAIVGRSPALPVAPDTGNVFAVRIPVLAGQVLGIHTDVSGMACGLAGAAGDAVSYQDPFDGGTATSYAPEGTDQPYLVNLAAAVERDADGDGFGDATQDGCPLGAGTQDAARCKRPNTRITKAPAGVSDSRRITIAFKSTLRRSTFECQVDAEAYRPCSSPFTKRLSPGKHSVRIRATSRVGVPETKPAKVTVRITRR